MMVTTLSQPETQLGNEIEGLLRDEAIYQRIVFVSAFVALRTILRLRERLLEKTANGAHLRFTLGVDLGGTSREVLEELLRWRCETLLFHNAIQRATFHPKIYFFESATTATLLVGSNNLTDGGFYTNYEAATRYDFELPADEQEYRRLLTPLSAFLDPSGSTVRSLDADLIATLVARGDVPSETEARLRQRDQARARRREGANIPPNPFAAAPIPLPPLLPEALRREEPEPGEQQPVTPPETPSRKLQPVPALFQTTRLLGALMWRKKLPQTDALQVNEGSHHVGGVRLTQARFEMPPGHRIDQTTYFRQLFADYHWELELGRHRDQEHTFVPMRIIIREKDYGVRNFEISHKPSGESGQDNYTTILRWGRDFNPAVLQENLTGATLSLYETAEQEADFLIEIN